MRGTMGATLRTLQAAMLLALLLACSDKIPRLDHLDPDARILAFGDSLTYGTGADREQAYPVVLASLIDREVINAGVPGETTAQGLARLPLVLDQTDPQLVILCLGGNDMLRKMDRLQMKRNLSAMVQLVRGRGIPLVLVGVPQPRIFGLSADPSYLELAREYGLPVEATALPEILGDSARKSDHIHPNGEGYADLARAIADLLRGAGAV